MLSKLLLIYPDVLVAQEFASPYQKNLQRMFGGKDQWQTPDGDEVLIKTQLDWGHTKMKLL